MIDVPAHSPCRVAYGIGTMGRDRFVGTERRPPTADSFPDVFGLVGCCRSSQCGGSGGTREGEPCCI